MRVWRRICLDKHTGQVKGFDMSCFFPHRTPGSLVLYCVQCPEDGYNMEEVYLQLRTHGYAHSLEPGWSDIPQRGYRSEPRSSYEGLSRQAFLTPTEPSSIAIMYGAVSPSALTSIGIVHHLHGVSQ